MKECDVDVKKNVMSRMLNRPLYSWNKRSLILISAFSNYFTGLVHFITKEASAHHFRKLEVDVKIMLTKRIETTHDIVARIHERVRYLAEKLAVRMTEFRAVHENLEGMCAVEKEEEADDNFEHRVSRVRVGKVIRNIVFSISWTR